MIGFFLGVLLFLSAPGAVFAQQAEAQATPITPPPMRFEWVREGPAETCRDKCREWISATGNIVESTPKDFEAFLKGRDARKATIVLESNGGMVQAALTLGRKFRSLEVTTTVGKTVKLPVAAGAEERYALSNRALCNSMCSFLLLGGARRYVPDEARIHVHQIWPSNKREDATAATYSAANMLSLQRVLGQVARYTVEMGADIELFEVSTRIPPWEGLRPLTKDELRRMRVHNVDGAFDGTPVAVDATSSSQPVTSIQMPVALVAKGWELADVAGRRVLKRSHPITIEGQEIGAFDIMVACAELPGIYRVAYLEKRTAQANKGLSDRLNAVRIGVKAERTMLKVESSSLDAASSEIRSVARGVVSGALVKALAAPGGASLVIETLTNQKVRTTIRVGDSGLLQGLPQITGSCPR